MPVTLLAALLAFAPAQATPPDSGTLRTWSGAGLAAVSAGKGALPLFTFRHTRVSGRVSLPDLGIGVLALPISLVIGAEALRRTLVKRLRHGAIAALALLPFASGCVGGWRCEPVEVLTQAPPRLQVQVWTGRSVTTLHAVRITSDSIAGVPFFRPPSCDSCRLAFARARVDSVRVGNPEASFAAGLALGLLFSMLLLGMLLGDMSYT